MRGAAGVSQQRKLRAFGAFDPGLARAARACPGFEARVIGQGCPFAGEVVDGAVCPLTHLVEGDVAIPRRLKTARVPSGLDPPRNHRFVV